MRKAIFALVPIMFLFAGSIILGGCVTPGPAPGTPSGGSKTEPAGMSVSSCRQYADMALRQINERIERTGSAPLHDPVWSKDWNLHYNWCANSARPGEPEAGTRNRQEWLSAHSAQSSGKSKEAFCRQYAEGALRQISERIERTGPAPANDPVWKKDYNHHYNWCLQAPESASTQGSKLREDWLNQHRRK